MTTATSSASVIKRAMEILQRAREICDQLLQEAISTLPDPLNRMACYQFGWRDATGLPLNTEPGKALRPALVLAAAACCGARSKATHCAAAVELVHNFTLIHDDIMDADDTRRGRPTIWKLWGVADAVLVGDALHALAANVLANGLPDALASEAIVRLETTVGEMCRGQHEDCALDIGRITVEKYIRMAMGKTGALMGCACALGALCAGADNNPMISTMDRFGRQLGLAFQFVDDLIGIWGDPEITGKPTDDLARRKLSLPVVAALTSGTKAAAELAAMYREDTPWDQEAVKRATALIEAAGGRLWTQQHADRLIRDAINALPHHAASDDLMVLAHMISRRER
ncbi:polyprenyl synthetase family protein [Nocardia terpenica]|uniref:Polyprenyl synthetase n=1 Tax=Nocardia terpenica TaxID=455432 RepID=A0A291RNT7_9NOCA|nr:polyprenyl synthetase family protein [Nocardia terpenica]ATL69226.1 polyprenyl synthetase [Nocardia terpenica]